jgi:hypothetical protein
MERVVTLEKLLYEKILPDSQIVIDEIREINTDLSKLARDINIMLKEIEDNKKQNSIKHKIISLNEKFRMLQEMRELLNDYDSQALVIFGKLQDYITDEKNILLYEELGKLLNQYDFENAVVICDKLIEKYLTE